MDQNMRQLVSSSSLLLLILIIATCCSVSRAGCNADIGGTDISNINVTVAGGSKGKADIAPGRTFNLTFQDVLSWSTEVTALNNSVFAVAVFQNGLLLAKDYNLECVGWPRMAAGSCPNGGTVTVMLLCDPSSNVTCSVEYWMSNDLARVNCALLAAAAPAGAPAASEPIIPVRSASPPPLPVATVAGALQAPAAAPAASKGPAAGGAAGGAYASLFSPPASSGPRLLLNAVASSSVCKGLTQFNKCMTALAVNSTGAPGAPFSLVPQIAGCDAGAGAVAPGGASASGRFGASGWAFEVDAGQGGTASIRFNYSLPGGAWGWCSAVYDVDGGCVLGQCSRGASPSPVPAPSSPSAAGAGAGSAGATPSPSSASASSSGGQLAVDLAATSSTCKAQAKFSQCLQQLSVDTSGGGFTLRPAAAGCDAGGGMPAADGSASGDFPGGWSFRAVPIASAVEVQFNYTSSQGGPGYCDAIYNVASGCVLGKCAS